MQDYARLRELLIKHEGMRLKPYRDTMGKLTIGVGRNIEELGINELEAFLMLSHDLERVHKEAIENFKWFKSLSLARQDVILSMLFNLGLPKFLRFKKMMAWLSVGNYTAAAKEMMESMWALQVGKRAEDLAHMMETGQYPVGS